MPSKASANTFTRVAPDVDFPALEDRILELWDETNAFAESVDRRPIDREFTFYDGPPFPTGSPHYGNLLAGVLKDVVPRYWTMRGYRVERRFGWDTHGLPIEMEVQQDLGLKGPADVERFGVDAFNEACRARVETNTETWEAITRRMGRWVDFENDYKTMDLDFMESVWWVFRQLWDKGLIYQAFKVLPYSYGATTPLSNFEAGMDYRDIEDPSITVRLRVLKDHGPLAAGDYLLIWTTTPWTLPGNLAIAVREDIRYVRIDDELEGKPGRYWLAADLVETYWQDRPEPATEATGDQLVGAFYEPPFDYFGEERDRGAFVVLPSDDVNTEEGTGLVHMAPSYGEADLLALQAAGLDVLVDPVDAEATFTDEVPDVAGMHVKDADARLIELLDERGLLVSYQRITHSYPFCWRTGTPLIYKAIPTWFVRVESFRERMVEVNKRIHWVPDYVGSRRFDNWLASARDWAISRNRYWGSCIPVWECDSCEESVCIGSVAELEERSGVRLNDLHKQFVDPVTFPCSECQGTMRRVPEVLDCWFESGSMPYAQNHYPFEDADTFSERFPADFIAEGLDMTRGWFYTLVVLSTALFDEIPFKNCVVNGMILAEDGRKMSKSLKNYPDPFEVVAANGGDALRAYLINSPVVRAEPLRFTEQGVREVARRVMLPYWNAYSFFTTYAEADRIGMAELAKAPPPKQRAEIDRWILSALQSLIRQVNEQMEGYYLYAVIPHLLEFIGDLTNWYIRRSRRRFWRKRRGGSNTDERDKLAAFATLYEALETFGRVIAPVLPFITEEIYQGLVVSQRDERGAGPPSVHHCDYPEAEPPLIDRDLERQMAVVRNLVSLGRGLRVANGLKVRQPLPRLTVITRDDDVARAVTEHLDLITEELNVKEVATAADEEPFVNLRSKADFRVLGPRLGAAVKEVAAALEELPREAVAELVFGGELSVAGHRISKDDVVVAREPKEGVVVATEGSVSVALDCTLRPELVREGMAREIVNRIQGLRRDLGLQVYDRISLGWSTESQEVAGAFEAHGELIAEEVLAERMDSGVGEGVTVEVNGQELVLAVEKL